MSGSFSLVNSIVKNNLGVCQVFVVVFCIRLGQGLYHGFGGGQRVNSQAAGVVV